MNLINSGLMEFIEKNCNTKIYCFGAGIIFRPFYNNLEYWGLDKNLVGIIDNNTNKQGTFFVIEDKKYAIISLQEFENNIADENKQDMCLVITAGDEKNILHQVEHLDIIVYCAKAMYGKQRNINHFEYDIRNTEEMMIPKKIHYCWFGNSEMPDEYKRNIEEWHELCPDYEIVLWNEKNYNITKNKYMLQAYEQKKWGFVPDYARLDIIYNEGGVYFDTDVKLVKNIDDLLYNHAFMIQFINNHVAPGLGLGAGPGHSLVKQLRDYYDEVSFIRVDGKMDMMPCDVHQAKVLKTVSYKYDGQCQKIDNMMFFPSELNGMNNYMSEVQITDKTYLIHQGHGTWMDKDQLKSRDENMKFLYDLTHGLL